LELEGRDEHPGAAPADPEHVMAPVWTDPHGLILILHNEQSSRKENALEREIVSLVLDAYPDAPRGSIAILSPHRGQRGLLQEQLDGVAAVAAIDTVERLQGGEAPTVIVTATASDPGQIQAAEDFLLNINRSNVAFSRAETRLVIVASEALLDHVAADLEVYEAAMLWKEVRRVCSATLVETEVRGYQVRVMGYPTDALRTAA
jgi:superfamily I DNA and/or RNA helicase